MPAPEPHPHLTLLLTIWAAVGPLAGIFFGHFLTRSWQRTRWLMDQRKDEFRELINALHDSMTAEATRYDSHFELTPQERRDKAKKTIDFYRTIRTRIFTASDMRNLEVEPRWREAVEQFLKDNDGITFEASYEALASDLVKTASAIPHKLQ